MKPIFRKLSVILTGVILLCGLVGCITSPALTSVNPTETKTVTLSSALPTLVPSATSTITQTPILIPPTPTIIPTLNEEDASAEILKLLSSTDDSCLFPCWWGLVPGQTRIANAQNYLSSFGILPGGGPKFSENEGYISFQYPQPQSSYINITYEFEGKNGILEWLRVSIWRNVKVSRPNGETSYEISWGDPNLAEITKPYNLSRVMSTYGRPSEVLVFTRQATLLNQPWPISLVVFYPEHGFMIEYVADDRPVLKNPGVTWCPSLAFPYFWFWSPSKETTIEDVVSWIDGYQLSYNWAVSGRFKTLEVATGTSIEDLYSLFTSDEDACVTTPAELWPMPGE